MALIAGAIFSTLAVACTVGAVVFGDHDLEGSFYFLAEAGAFVVAAMTCFGVFG